MTLCNLFFVFGMEELEIVSDATGESLGVFVPRHQAIAQRLWCRSTNIFVVNSQGHILCHQRSHQKERMPGMWCTHLGGHVSRHETFESNALKELEEESGIRVSRERLIPWRTSKLVSARLWVREFVVLHDATIDDLVPQPGEVEQFAWKTFADIEAEIAAGSASWCAGTLDFRTEYHCLVAVLTAAHSLGVVDSLVTAAAPM